MKNRKVIRNIQILKGMVITTGMILIIFGILMIFRDIKGQENIKIKIPFLEGNINTNYVGLATIFLGSVIIIVAILKTFRFSRKQRIVESEGLIIKEEEEIEMTQTLNKKGEEK